MSDATTQPFATLGARVRVCRQALGLTQDLLSVEADIPLWRVRAIEESAEGWQHVTVGQLIRLARTLKCSIPYLLFGGEDNTEGRKT